MRRWIAVCLLVFFAAGCGITVTLPPVYSHPMPPWGGWIWNGAGYVCPRADYPTFWTPGRAIPRPGDGVPVWAPACYR